MDEIPSFGAWLKRRRKALDLTQDALARRVGCAVVSIRKFEADTQRPSRQLAELLADHLAIPEADRATFVRFARVGLDAAPPELPLPAAATLPTATPQPATHDTAHPTGNLPARLASFIGREHEQADVTALLQNADVRLITLTGPGGAGKTSLALAVAAHLRAMYPDGVWFVDLAPLRDPDLVLATIAQVLGVRESGGRPLIDALQSYLRSKRMLLLLDNFEQVAAAAAPVHELLREAPDLTVLATCREPLRLTGEQQYAVQPMALPEAAAVAPDRILAADAVRLFVARAQATQADFVVAPGDAPTIAAICRQLDGLPLAIELAAARVRLLPLPALLARLDQRLALLHGRVRDLPARQQTMRAAIDWSYQLLDPAEQQLFRRLGVFAGGWTLEAAQAVCAGETGEVALLEELVEKSLVVTRAGIDGALRFGMLETIREFALEQLAAHGELAELQRRHAEYFRKLIDTAEPQLYGAQQKIWLDTIDQDHDNIRAVLTWSLAVSGAQVDGLQLASKLITFWAVRSYAHEGVAWLKQLLLLPTIEGTATRARALVAIGSLAENHSQLAEAVVWLEEALSLYRRLEDLEGIALALMHLGRCRYWLAAYAEAQPILDESCSIFVHLGNRTRAMWAYLSLGDCAFYRNDAVEARQHFNKALALSQQLEDTHGYAWARLCLGRVEWALGEYHSAHAHAVVALDHFRRLQQKTESAHAELELARISETQGHLPQAYDFYTRSLIQFVYQRLQRVPECLEGIAGLTAEQVPEQAARLFGAANTLRATNNFPLPPVYRPAYERTLAAARAALGDTVFAAAFAAGQMLTLDEAVAEALALASPGAG